MSIKVACTPNVCFFSLSTIPTFTKSSFPSQCCQLYKKLYFTKTLIDFTWSFQNLHIFEAKISQNNFLKIFQIGNTGFVFLPFPYTVYYTPPIFLIELLQYAWHLQTKSHPKHKSSSSPVLCMILKKRNTKCLINSIAMNICNCFSCSVKSLWR